jgi:hypothetical protein
MAWMWDVPHRHMCWMFDSQLVVLFWEVVETLWSETYWRKWATEGGCDFEINIWSLVLCSLSLILFPVFYEVRSLLFHRLPSTWGQATMDQKQWVKNKYFSLGIVFLRYLSQWLSLTNTTYFASFTSLHPHFHYAISSLLPYCLPRVWL